jgi:uncharacterized protein YndB with AHSA1/START domain
VRGRQIVQFGVYTEVNAPNRFVRTERWEDWDPGETLVIVDIVEERGKTMMTQRMVFPSREVRDVVMKGGLTPKGTSEFYDRLETLLTNL